MLANNFATKLDFSGIKMVRRSCMITPLFLGDTGLSIYDICITFKHDRNENTQVPTQGSRVRTALSETYFSREEGQIWCHEAEIRNGGFR